MSMRTFLFLVFEGKTDLDYWVDAIVNRGIYYKQNLENLRRNHYAPIRHGSPCVTYETKVMRPQGAKRCAPSKATFLIMRSRP